MKKFKNFWSDESGQDLVEYALMAGFVAVAAGAIMPKVASATKVAVLHFVAWIQGQEVASLSHPVDDGMLRLVYAGLGVFFLGWIVWRRDKKYEEG